MGCCAAFPHPRCCGNPACASLEKFSETGLAKRGCQACDKVCGAAAAVAVALGMQAACTCFTAKMRGWCVASSIERLLPAALQPCHYLNSACTCALHAVCLCRCPGMLQAVRFCSTECHTLAWKSGHKAACAVLKQRQGTAAAGAPASAKKLARKQ